MTNIKRKNIEESSEKVPFTYVSLFSGIGGFEQALNKLGGKCILASEIDKFAAKAYETLYGHKPAGDITQIDAKDIPNHDLLVGGFACKSFSVAGKRGGFEDARGTLFFEVARIAAEKKPKALLLENVKGLVGHDKGRTLDTIVKTLNEIGYRVDFDVLNSKYFGVPPGSGAYLYRSRTRGFSAGMPWAITKGNTIVPKGKRRISDYEDVKTFNFDFPQNDTVTTRLRDILETEVDEKYYLDEEKTAKLVAQLEGVAYEEPIECTDGFGTTSEDLSYCLTTRYDNGFLPSMFRRKERTAVIEPSEPQMLGHVDIKGHDSIKRVYDVESVGQTLTTMGGGHREPKIAEEQEVRPVLTPDRLEKRQNGRRFKDDGEESFTLTSQDRHGVALGHHPKYRIRKLTPLECWRLQGFPDEAHEAVKAAGISDSQRYKQAGNAVTVNVIKAIGKRLIPILDEK